MFVENMIHPNLVSKKQYEKQEKQKCNEEVWLVQMNNHLSTHNTSSDELTIELSIALSIANFTF